MAAYYLDSSAIVKRYIRETGTAWVAGIFDPAGGNRLHTVSVSLVEVVSGIVRRGRSDRVAVDTLAETCRRIRRDFQNLFSIVGVSPILLNRAAEVAEKHALRAYDAIQLAAAMQVDSATRAVGSQCTVISADAMLNAAAITEGLTADDPNTHP
jgi:predicted nucleic acid-binding protein